MSWTSMRAAALVALALLPFLGAEPARAATAGLESGELRYDAAPGEVNQIALSYSWTDYLFTVRDADGVVVTPGAGCVQGTSPNEVVCEDFGRDPVLRAGDGDDTIAVTGVAAKLHGDAGPTCSPAVPATTCSTAEPGRTRSRAGPATTASTTRSAQRRSW